MDSKSASNFAFYNTQIDFLKKKKKFLLLALFANIKAEIERNGTKKQKSDFNFTSNSGLGGSILPKKA